MTDRLREIEEREDEQITYGDAPGEICPVCRTLVGETEKLEAELASARAQEEQLREIAEEGLAMVEAAYSDVDAFAADTGVAMRVTRKPLDKLQDRLAAVSAARDPEGQTR